MTKVRTAVAAALGAALAVVLLTGCYRPGDSDVVQAAELAGVTQVEVSSPHLLRRFCHRDDAYEFPFTGVAAATGAHVRGVVCSGSYGGMTVRILGFDA